MFGEKIYTLLQLPFHISYGYRLSVLTVWTHSTSRQIAKDIMSYYGKAARLKNRANTLKFKCPKKIFIQKFRYFYNLKSRTAENSRWIFGENFDIWILYQVDIIQKGPKIYLSEIKSNQIKSALFICQFLQVCIKY